MPLIKINIICKKKELTVFVDIPVSDMDDDKKISDYINKVTAIYNPIEVEVFPEQQIINSMEGANVWWT